MVSKSKTLRIYVAVVRVLTLLLLVCASFAGVSSANAAPAQQDTLDLTAHAAIVVEYPSGKILYEKNSTAHLAMASTTKIMTALLTLQRVKLTDIVTVPKAALVGEASMGLVEGEQISVESLLYGLLLPSGNDAAMTLAIYVGGTLSEPAEDTPYQRFIALMNSEAQAMGLTDSHFVTPHGLDAPGHYTSARDLVSIAWYALHDPEFNTIIKTVDKDVPGHSLENINRLLTRYPGTDGVKTGQTDNAGLCLVSSATRDGRRLVAVVLNADRWYDDSEALLDYGFAHQATASHDTLNIAKRAQMLWLLAQGLPTPLPTAYPTQAAATPVAAGAIKVADLPSPEAQLTATDPGLAPAPLASGNTLVQAQSTSSGMNWALPLLALLAGASVLFVYWRRSGGQKTTGRGDASWAEKKQRLTALGVAQQDSAAKNNPAAQLDAGEAAQFAKRGIAQAYRGQEDASLDGFMQAVARDPEFEFGTLEGFYDMPAAGYLRLARAYLENNRLHYAEALLQLGAETYPDDKPIRKMLAELTSQTSPAVAFS